MPTVLTKKNAEALRLVHDDLAYEPIGSDAVLGALLFVLHLDAVEFTGAPYNDRTELQLALSTARQFARILEQHAGRVDRAQPQLPGAVSIGEARGWLLAAAAAVPESELERFCWRAVRRLGRDPWADGSPAIALSQQQFALFEGGFDDSREAAEAP